jgi:adenylate kinase
MMKSSTKDQPLNIILLGDPAAGKATQAAFLVEKFGMYDFDMGKELNILRAKDSAVDGVLKNKTDKGNLTPTKIVRGILKDKIENTPKNKGILFDGHPKMLGEAQLVARLLKQQGREKPTVLYISIPVDETVKRMHNRQGYFAGKFGKRADDSDSALKNRARYYRKNVAQVITFFKSLYTFKKISGLGTKSQVKARILEALK